MGRVIGIDLGTFNSCVAVVEGGEPKVITSPSGHETLPSVISVAESGRRMVGHIAKRQAVTNAAATVYAAKRLIGRRFSSLQVTRMIEVVGYSIVEGPHDDPRVDLRGKVHSIPEISAMVLAELKHIAEEYFGEEIEEAVVTVPAYFNDGQRQATKDAGRIAGLDVISIVNEPTAAALAYGFGKHMDRTLAVYDLGGGTFDVSIMEISSTGVFKVIATAGDTFLGGEDFDQRIIDWLVVEFETDTGIDVRGDTMAMQRIKDAAEKAKCILSSEPLTEVNLPFLIDAGADQPTHLQKDVSREQLEELTHDLIARTIEICGSTLEESGLEMDEIEDVLLVGGMTRMPAVRRAVAAYFEREPADGVHPDLVVALGASVQGAALTEDEHDMVLLDVTPHTMGIVVAGGFMEEIVPLNSTVPVERAKSFTTTRDSQTVVKILVVQGESRRADENELIGQFELAGLRAAPMGHVELSVSFVIDMDGILSVEAKDLETGREQSIQITASSGLTEDEIEVMIDVAEEFAVARVEGASFEKLRLEAEAVVKEIETLKPLVVASVSGNDFGRSAVDEAMKVVANVQSLMAQGDEQKLESELGSLKRTLRLFRGAAMSSP